MRVFAEAMDRLDRISPTAFLWTNALLCLFVLLAHGGALLVVQAGKAPEMADAVAIAYFTVPVALVSLGFALVAFFRTAALALTLKVHSIFLLSLAVYMAYFGLSAAIGGIPTGVRFAWNPLLFAFVVGYPVLLIQRAFPNHGFSTPAFRYAPLIAVGISVLISVAVYWRAWAAP
jgi:hypothetical protein